MLEGGAGLWGCVLVAYPSQSSHSETILGCFKPFAGCGCLMAPRVPHGFPEHLPAPESLPLGGLAGVWATSVSGVRRAVRASGGGREADSGASGANPLPGMPWVASPGVDCRFWRRPPCLSGGGVGGSASSAPNTGRFRGAGSRGGHFYSPGRVTWFEGPCGALPRGLDSASGASLAAFRVLARFELRIVS